jgi:hypothetical protein
MQQQFTPMVKGRDFSEFIVVDSAVLGSEKDEMFSTLVDSVVGKTIVGAEDKKIKIVRMSIQIVANATTLVVWVQALTPNAFLSEEDIFMSWYEQMLPVGADDDYVAAV